MRPRRVPPNPRALLCGGVLVARVEDTATPGMASDPGSGAAPSTPGGASQTRAAGAARRAASVARVGGRLLAGLLVLLNAYLIVNLSGFTGMANADVLGVCVDSPGDNSWNPDQVRSGMDGLIPQALPNGTWASSGGGPLDSLPEQGDPVWSTPEQAMNDTSYTDYEKLGMAGTFWSVDYGSMPEGQTPCFPLEKMIGNFVANRIFDLAKVIDRVAISTYQWATSGAIAQSLDAPLDEAVGLFYDGEGGEGGFGLVRSLVVVAIVAGVVWVAWMAVARRRFALGLGGIAWMVAAFVALMLFIGKPSAIASTADQVVSDTTQSVMSTSSAIIQSGDGGRIDAIYGDLRSQEHGPGRISADMMWRVLVFQPWATGQWGSSTEPVWFHVEGVDAGDASQFYAPTEADAADRNLDARLVQLYAQACLLTPGSCTGQIAPAVPISEDVTQVRDNNLYYAPTIDRAFSHGRWWWAVENWTCKGSSQCLQSEERAGMDADVLGTHYRAIWSGDKAGHRIMAALTALLAAILLGGMIFLISAAVIAYGLMMYMLLLLGPFMLLVGIHPSFGRRLAIGWANVLIQNVFKRLFLGILLAIIVLIYAVIGRADVGWFQQMALMVGATVGVLLLRAPLMAAIGVVRVGEGSAALEGTDDRAVSGAQRAGRGALAGAGAVGSRSVRGAGMAGRGLVGAGVGYRRASEYADREGVPAESRRRVITSGTLGGVSGAARGRIRGGAATGATKAASDRWQQIDDQNLAATARSHGDRWRDGQEAIRQRRSDRVIRAAYRRSDGAPPTSGQGGTTTAQRLNGASRGTGGERGSRGRVQPYVPPQSEEQNRRTNPPRPGPAQSERKYRRQQQPTPPPSGGQNGGQPPPPMPAQPQPPRSRRPRPTDGDQPTPPPRPDSRRQR